MIRCLDHRDDACSYGFRQLRPSGHDGRQIEPRFQEMRTNSGPFGNAVFVSRCVVVAYVLRASVYGTEGYRFESCAA